ELRSLAETAWFRDGAPAPAEIGSAIETYLAARHRWIELCIARATAKLLLREGVSSTDISRNLHLLVDVSRDGLVHTFMGTRGKTFTEASVKLDLTDLPNKTAKFLDLVLDRSRNPMVLARLLRLASALTSEG